MHCLSRKPSYYLVNSYSDMKESNEQRREGFEAAWLDLVMETRPEENVSLAENNSMRKESYEQRQWTHFTVRRNPDQTLAIGRYGDKEQRFKLPFKNVLPLPLFVPKNIAQQNEQNRSHIPTDYLSTTEFNRSSLIGICAEKKDLSQIAKDLPPIIQPSRLDFRASRA